MFGAITGKIFLTAAVVIISALSIALTFYRYSQRNTPDSGLVPTIIRVVVPLLVCVLVWRLFWH
ncbi:hypothetical protein GS501_04685 [Saccharibacter sp. 17.LH.SD]|uniref:hypothetical protein n=1 Tax=Saccharibacter sp. 17.LH.SD TaxID=2689393 RepID=UPI00136E240E|nr:hypothetical protein [Saccharibacter sp. 17.LH.SD]MXV44342.1 hypothetical protein [Saccharibacter sp. 17.LH.SD]